MKDFDKIIEQSFVEFDLPEGHEQRFLNKLPQKQKKQTRSLRLMLVASAAVILVAVLLLKPMNRVETQSPNQDLAEYAEFMMLSMTDEVLTLARERLPEADYLELEATYNQMVEDLRELDKLKGEISPERYERLMRHQLKITGNKTASIIRIINK